MASPDSARECSLLEDPLNGRVDVDTYRYGGLATYSCDEGYRLQGPDRAICLTNGEFEPREPPICRRKYNRYILYCWFTLTHEK